MIENLVNFWDCTFGDFSPEAHKLKYKFPCRWVRFHTLPDSKRYPDTEDEYLEILRRHNKLLNGLCNSGEVCFVVFAEYSESAIPTKPRSDLTCLFPNMEYWRSVTKFVKDQDDFHLHFHASKTNFTGTEFNPLIRLIANDEAANVLIAYPTSGFIYHPYDGGTDVILESKEQRDVLKAKYSNWLSSHPDGL
jgi:hypothetical protein